MNLYKHQAEGLQIVLENPRWGFYWKPGLGKSRLIVEVIKQLKFRTLIIAPLSILDSVWRAEFSQWAPEAKIVNLWHIPKAQRPEAAKKGDVVIINYDAFKSLEPQLDPKDFGILIVDEAGKLRGRTTQVAKSIMRFAKKVERCYLLSGTPAPNSPLEWWPQLDTLSPGILGKSWWAFRNEFFTPDYMRWNWAIKPQKEKDLKRRIASVSSYLTKEDCLDLPERTFIVRDVMLSESEWAAYRQMKRDLLIEFGNSTVLAQNAMVKIMKLRELTSGFAHAWGTEAGVARFGNSKLKVLLELLDDLGSERAVIWCFFREEINQIRQALGSKIGLISGDIPQKQRDEYLAAWDRGEIQHMICHPLAAGHGLNNFVIDCSHAIYFSLSHSLDLWEQSLDRLHRPGQKRPVTYHLLMAREPSGEATIDQEIYEALQGKDLTAKKMLEGLRK